MSTDGSLHVMSLNLRCATGERQNAWPERRPVVRALLEQEHPDVLGTQEGLPDQLRDLTSDLPAHYASVGEGREGGGRGEAMQVFWDTRRLRALGHGHFWLSDTPEVPGSRSWGGDWPRMVTWVRFLDLLTDRRVGFLDTHLEAFSATARARSAELITELLPSDLPVVLVGDFNEPAAAGEAVYDTLVRDGPLVDSWVAAAERGHAWGTFHDYGPLVRDGDRIDWILTSPDVAIASAAINDFSLDGRVPSDHLPVQARVVLP